MRLTMILCTAMISGILPLYIISNGFQASIPLVVSLITAIIASMFNE